MELPLYNCDDPAEQPQGARAFVGKLCETVTPLLRAAIRGSVSMPAARARCKPPGVALRPAHSLFLQTASHSKLPTEAAPPTWSLRHCKPSGSTRWNTWLPVSRARICADTRPPFPSFDVIARHDHAINLDEETHICAPAPFYFRGRRASRSFRVIANVLQCETERGTE